MGMGKGEKGKGGIMAVLQALMGGGGKGKGKRDNGPKLTTFDADRKVWVGGLPTEKPTWKDLNELFKGAGSVKWVAPLGKKDSGEACVVMGSAEEATAAIAQLQGSVIQGSAIQLDVWTKKET